MPRISSLAILCMTSVFPGIVWCEAALAPAQVFERVQPSVFVIETLSADGRLLGSATAIALDNGRFVSACTVLEGSDAIRIASTAWTAAATLTARDPQRNLCLLSAPTPAIAMAPAGAVPAVGERVFAVSNALGLGVGLSEGVISGVRRHGDANLLQFSAPISPGSEGGALVDAKGQLLGVIDYRQRDGQNVNFAAPVAWIAEIEARSEQDTHRLALRDRAPRLMREAAGEQLAELAGDWTRRYPEDADGWAWLAISAQMRRDFVSEEQAWRKAQQLDPQSVNAGLGIAGALLRQQRFAEARDIAQGLLALRQEDPWIWAALGQARHGSKEAAPAEEAYRHALSLDPWHLAAHEGLIALAGQRGDHAAVTAGWANLVRLYPGRADLRWRQVESLLVSAQAARAHALLARLPAELTGSGDALFWQAATLVGLGRPHEAIGVFRDSLAKAPSDPARGWSELGKLYHSLHRFPESIAAHREAVRLAPDVPDRRFWLAVALKDGGHLAEALEIDRRLVAELPNEAGAWRQLGMASAAAVHTEASIAAIERSLALDPTQVRLWSLLIEQYHAAGRRDDVLRAHARLRGLDARAAERSYRATIAPYETATK